MHAQVADEIYDAPAASKMGIERVGQVMIMIHSGSRGLGHQVGRGGKDIIECCIKRDIIEMLSLKKMEHRGGRGHQVG
jgi:tRNA-splicing ligase RtcB